jgi:radical SAM superfamily enzyme YgiQ (UPF0313 family)
MKIIISYPPLNRDKGCATLGQNRQFQYFKEPTYIYPVVPAQAATLLKQAGHEVIWNDCLAENWSYEGFLKFVEAEKPDILAFETKTPVIKQHWKIINDLKNRDSYHFMKSVESDKMVAVPIFPLTVLFGDHVTALPEESFENSQVDFVLTGGDYDFLLLNLCNFLNDLPKTENRKPRIELEPGIYYRENGKVTNTGHFQLNHNLDLVPFIDRDLTKWQFYAYKNGNYKLTPGTYIMSGRDCWWGKCTFCSWPTLYPSFRNRSPGKVLDEIGDLIKRYGVKEIMDDSGSFPTGKWLKEFCSGMLARGFNKKIYLDCNMRFGALSEAEYRLMKKAGFRLMLFGLESANQKTLDRIHKNVKVEDIIASCKLARKSGLFPHITIMFGYPWETYEEALNTLKLGQWLLTKGYAYTMQATMVIPYPGAPLFEECKKHNWLSTLDWNAYDMKQPVMYTPMPQEQIMKLVQGMYKVSFNPEFIVRKLFSIRDAGDLKYYFRAARKVAGHVFDFKKPK